MSEQKHTAGPWELNDDDSHSGEWDGSYRIFEPLSNFVVAVIKQDGREIGSESTKSDARRIVACVNACDGLDDPEQLRAQRDKAVDALEAIERWPGNLPDERYESATGPNDAMSRGLMVTSMRRIARSVLADIKQPNEG